MKYPTFSKESKEKLYEDGNIKSYVDRYCSKHQVTPEQAFDQAIVRAYICEYAKKINSNKKEVNKIG